MNKTELLYINHCKYLIEQKLNWPASDQWRQRDYLNLTSLLESKTNITLSLSTIKRIWKPDYEGTPHPATLEALARFLDYNSWLDFTEKHPHIAENQTTRSPIKIKEKTSRIFRKMVAAFLLVILFSVATFLLLPGYLEKRSGEVYFDPEQISFSCDNSVSSGVPNTVLFHYDLTGVKADSFFIQQSWNRFRRDKVLKENSTLTSIYYYPGFHKAKLIANDSVIKETNVRINTNGWLALARYGFVDENPVYLSLENPAENGVLHISAQHLTANKVEINRDLIVSYYYVNDFKNLSSRNFILETNLRCDSIINISCPLIGLLILGEFDMNFIPLTVKGCIGNTSVKFGDVIKSGKNNDLSSLGVDVYKWQLVRIEVNNAVASIFVNDQLAFSAPLEKDIGDIAGVAINFLGTGEIDFLTLSPGSGEQPVYATNF